MKNLKSYLVFLVGLIIFGAGLAFANESMLGSDPMGVFVSGMTMHLPLTFGTCNLIVNIFEALFGYIFDRKRVSWVTVVSMFIASYAIDLAEILIPNSTNIVIRIIYMFLGVICLAIGIALEQIACVGLGALDCFIFALGKLLKIKEYHKIRWITDASFVLLGILLGGVFNIGTILFVIFAGILIEYFKNHLPFVNKWIKVKD